MIDLTAIISAAITIIAALVTTFLIPWIKANTTKKQQENMLLWVEVAVNAAEQIYKGTGRGAEKKAYVLNFLNEHGYTADMEEIEAALEAFVLQLQ